MKPARAYPSRAAVATGVGAQGGTSAPKRQSVYRSRRPPFALVAARAQGATFAVGRRADIVATSHKLSPIVRAVTSTTPLPCPLLAESHHRTDRGNYRATRRATMATFTAAAPRRLHRLRVAYRDDEFLHPGAAGRGSGVPNPDIEGRELGVAFALGGACGGPLDQSTERRSVQ